MLVVLNDSILNLHKADKLVKDEDNSICFWRDDKCYQRIKFSSLSERDREWSRITHMINTWYS